MKTTTKQLRWLGLAVAAGLVLAGSAVRAGDHWFSRNTENKPAPRTFYSGPQKQDADSSVVFDIVVSVYTNRTTLAERAPYEQIINYFAQALYEESNGAHKLGTVRIYTKGKHASSCDILWQKLGHPCADAGGYGTSGKHIYMFDVFKDGAGSGVDYDLLTHTDGAGYTIGHEWGHYTYCVFDEYVGDAASRTANRTYFPWDTDTGVTNAIMNSQWKAAGGHYAWLNFSTALNDTHNTAQYRSYGASCWEVMARPTSADPRTGARVNLPTRTYWTYLATFAPGSNSWPSIELPTAVATATNALKIVWMTDDVAMQIVIDASGSMYPYYTGDPDKLGYAKSAAKSLVDVIPVPASNSAPSTSIGIIAFDDSVNVVQGLTLIDSQATKNALKAAIDGIDMGGSTAIFDAAQTALNGLLAGGNTNRGMITFLLSDGQDNSSSYSGSTVIGNYQTAKVPIFTFGFGNDVDASTLMWMSSDTGGRYYFSPASQAEIQSAFLDANQVALDIQGLSSGTPSVAPGGTMSNSFSVDSTAGTLTIAVTHDGGTNSFDLTLIEPDNTTTHAPTSCDTGSSSSTLCTFTIQNPVSGNWTLRYKSNLASTSDLTYNVQTAAKAVVTYSLNVASLGGAAIQYPQPIALIATLTSSLPIAGAGVTALVTLPNGGTQTVALADNGVAPDAVANDGVYSALYNPTQNGSYQFTVVANNNAGTARLTYAGVQPSAGVSGVIAPPADVTIAEKFQRQANLQVQVSGVISDDYGNTPTAYNVGYIAINNSNYAGRIDYTNDVDFFSMYVGSSTSSIVVRVSNLSPGLLPILKIYDSTGTNVLGQGSLSNAASATGYVALQITQVAGKTIYASVSNTTAALGTYDISAGAAVVSDAPSYDTCLQDEKLKRILEIDTKTGKYEFTDCATSTILTGTGKITKSKTGLVVTLTDKQADRTLTAVVTTTVTKKKVGKPPVTVTTSSTKGTASVTTITQVAMPHNKTKTVKKSYPISDKNTANNTCSCQ